MPIELGEDPFCFAYDVKVAFKKAGDEVVCSSVGPLSMEDV